MKKTAAQKLTAEQRAAVERWCYLELADAAGEEYGDPFKDRYETQPREVNNPDDTDEGQAVADAADDYFFVVMKRLANELRAKGKA